MRRRVGEGGRRCCFVRGGMHIMVNRQAIDSIDCMPITAFTSSPQITKQPDELRAPCLDCRDECEVLWHSTLAMHDIEHPDHVTPHRTPIPLDITPGGFVMEKIPASPAAPPPAAPAGCAGGVRSSGRLGGVSGVRRGAGESGPVRRIRFRFLLPVLVSARTRARRVSGDRISVRRGQHCETFRRRLSW